MAKTQPAFISQIVSVQEQRPTRATRRVHQQTTCTLRFVDRPSSAAQLAASYPYADSLALVRYSSTRARFCYEVNALCSATSSAVPRRAIDRTTCQLRYVFGLHVALSTRTYRIWGTNAAADAKREVNSTTSPPLR